MPSSPQPHRHRDHSARIQRHHPESLLLKIRVKPNSQTPIRMLANAKPSMLITFVLVAFVAMSSVVESRPIGVWQASSNQLDHSTTSAVSEQSVRNAPSAAFQRLTNWQGNHWETFERPNFRHPCSRWVAGRFTTRQYPDLPKGLIIQLNRHLKRNHECACCREKCRFGFSTQCLDSCH